MKTRKSERRYKVYTIIGDEWFTLLAGAARTTGAITVLSDVVNLDENGAVLDRWAEVKLSNVPLLLARL